MEVTELSQAVNIFNCKNTTVQIKGKANAVTLREFYYSSLNCDGSMLMPEANSQLQEDICVGRVRNL